MFEIKIEPGSETWAMLAGLTSGGAPVTLQVTPPWSEPLFVHGDKVQVEFDNGLGTAVVESADDTYVQVTYGPRQKYRTSLPRCSVITDRRREYPAQIEVVT